MLKDKFNALKERMEMTEETKEELKAVAKKAAANIVVGILVSVAITQGAAVVNAQIEEVKIKRAAKNLEVMVENE